jgi:hypothetical protein
VNLQYRFLYLILTKPKFEVCLYIYNRGPAAYSYTVLYGVYLNICANLPMGSGPYMNNGFVAC